MTIVAAVLAVVALIAIVAAAGQDSDTPARAPGPLDVQAWTPYRTLDNALPELEARADTLHALSPYWFRTTGPDTIEVEPEAPAAETARFVDTARRRDIPLIASIRDGTEARAMAGVLADPATWTAIDTISAQLRPATTNEAD